MSEGLPGGARMASRATWSEATLATNAAVSTAIAASVYPAALCLALASSARRQAVGAALRWWSTPAWPRRCAAGSAGSAEGPDPLAPLSVPPQDSRVITPQKRAATRKSPPPQASPGRRSRRDIRAP